MTEYRAFDKSGVIIGLDDLSDTDAALAWGFTIARKGAALVERKAGEHWVCFQEYRTQRDSEQARPGD
jgi:hypothetical protein